MKCKICNETLGLPSPVEVWCGSCYKAWEHLIENGSIVTVANWAAARARRYKK